jgi:putative ABC transport system permease protein
MTVQTAGMIRSNEVAFRDWIDATVKADLLIYSGGAATANAQPRSLSPELAKEVLAALPKGTRLVGEKTMFPPWSSANRRSTPSLDGESEQDATIISLVLLDAAEHYTANLERGESVESLRLWKRLAEEPGAAIVSETFALLHDVRVGDTISLHGKHGVVHWKVIGTIVDYNWIRGGIWVDRLSNAEQFDALEVSAWDVYLPPESRGDAGEIRDALQKSSLGARHALIGLTREEVRDNFLGIVRQIYGLAYMQELLVGIVAVLGVVTALVISVLSRQRELGLLRAVGATRPQVMSTVLAEAVLIGLVGTVLGIALGLPLEWYAVRVILFEEAGYLFPVRIPWVATGIIAGLAILSATLAGLAPAMQAVRLRITEAIAYE